MREEVTALYLCGIYAGRGVLSRYEYLFLRRLLADEPDHSARATAYLARIERGEFKAHLAVTVVFETVYTLQRFYQQPKAAIRDALLPLLELPGIILPGKDTLRTAFELYVDLDLPFADAYHAALMKHQGLRELVSFDRDFDRIPGINRIEPF
ncbi:MAG TPA: PIN domain-containing protein [Caldilineaceae bacterium]|nr:PIN domain-containing protein [Caldilineaceae bacterium]